jgi:hypothetical protein
MAPATALILDSTRADHGIGGFAPGFSCHLHRRRILLGRWHSIVECPRRNSLIFAIHLWNPIGPVPRSIWEVFHRQKDIQYSSRIATHISRQQQTHRLRHVISQLVQRIPREQRDSEAVKDFASYGCVTQMHVVRLLAPRISHENHTKDIDFSAPGIRARRAAGYAAAMEALQQAPWQGNFDPIEGHFARGNAANAACGGMIGDQPKCVSVGVHPEMTQVPPIKFPFGSFVDVSQFGCRLSGLQHPALINQALTTIGEIPPRRICIGEGYRIHTNSAFHWPLRCRYHYVRYFAKRP